MQTRSIGAFDKRGVPIDGDFRNGVGESCWYFGNPIQLRHPKELQWRLRRDRDFLAFSEIKIRCKIGGDVERNRDVVFERLVYRVHGRFPLPESAGPRMARPSTRPRCGS